MLPNNVINFVRLPLSSKVEVVRMWADNCFIVGIVNRTTN